jgi:diaminohydroxyphosphoribosylaminopyrimidine deaminase/5-amino-6-(5-phosphoribosylamino)uracil reductase
MSEIEKFIQQALDLAEKGRGFTSPNPMVGAVVVKDGIILGEGYHAKFGREHAEVIALRQAGEKARGAELYVNLEPCCFFGKTPPCVEAIIAAGIRKVYIAMIDPNPRVNGRGIAALQAAGIEVQVGILEQAAQSLNRGFISLMTKNRPWITLKLALTADGFIADASGRSRYLTGETAREYVKQQRQQHDAVAVGLGTVFKDDPQLLPLDRQNFIPRRIVFDEQFNIPERMKLVTDEHRSRTLILTGGHQKVEKAKHFHGLGVAVEEVPLDQFGWIDIAAAFQRLGELGITSVYCEGGSQLAGSLINARLVDELQLFYAPKILGMGLRSFSGIMKSLDEAIKLQWTELKQFDEDIFIRGIIS